MSGKIIKQHKTLVLDTAAFLAAPYGNGVPKICDTEYLLVTDKDSKIIMSSNDWYRVVKQANMIRRAGGEVTIFKSTKG